MKLKRSFPVKDDAGRIYTINEYVTSVRTTSFGAPPVDLEGVGDLYLDGQHVNNLGDGRYEIVDTGQILYEVK